jgi:hypothetical protein
VANKELIWLRAGAAASVVLLGGCGRKVSIGTGPAALEATPAVEFSLDREVEAVETELTEVPLEERFAIRTERVREAEEAARRRSVDEGGDVMAALLAIRDRMAETPEAHAEFAAAERARVARNEGFPVTEEDRAHGRELDRILGLSADLEARAARVREARREDIESAARHVDPPEYAVDLEALQLEGTVDPSTGLPSVEVDLAE